MIKNRVLDCLLLCFLYFLVACTNYNNTTNSTIQSKNSRYDTQKYDGCEGLQTLLYEIRSLTIQHYDAATRVAEMESQSNLLTNPLGWSYAIAFQEELISERDGLARKLVMKKDLYNILLLTSPQNTCR